jgi:class 3 adenylate cyclase
MPSPKIKRYIYQIIPFGLIWLIFGIVCSLLVWGLLDLAPYSSKVNPYDFGGGFFVIPVISLVSGLLIGAIEVLYLSKLFREKSFSVKIIYKPIIYQVVINLFLLIGAAITISVDLKTDVFSKQVWDNVWTYFLSYAFAGTTVYMVLVIIVSLFYAEVSENLGPGVLVNFFTGKYHTPIEEERIYMFLDMKSSTTIAENLGHVRYFEMLREYYADISSPIIKYSGEIYQYVGDEVIVSWTLKKGLQNNNCIQCFFAMKEALEKQAPKYRDRFGLLPGFKAGFHMGKLTTGEIGVIKKNIMFTGDVLNTTARIQELCNTYNVDILISDYLQKRLAVDAQRQIKPLGKNELRGRDEKIELFTILLS